ncbi:hypothetical protein B7494_g6921 [Chlorociboria aeruginascens]|nr:hypothetical protein B7494_g6921 [Chlorociboria aeruginascens]
MPPTPTIHRFLLPQRGSIWRPRLLTAPFLLRYASGKPFGKKAANSKSSKPLVLEKPTKFNPPSHGSKLPKDRPRYTFPGPTLSKEEVVAKAKRKYPHMMPAEGTFMHWFLHNKSIHIWITLTTLFTLAGTVFITNFKRNSPFVDMVPHWSQMFVHPIAYTGTCLEVLKLTSAHTTAATKERRRRRVEDVVKRAEYRKAHGLDNDEGFGGWTAKSDAEMGPGMRLGDGSERVVQHKPVKKWLGIW